MTTTSTMTTSSPRQYLETYFRDMLRDGNNAIPTIIEKHEQLLQKAVRSGSISGEEARFMMIRCTTILGSVYEQEKNRDNQQKKTRKKKKENDNDD